MEYSIGEFSRIVRISVKALRFYHEKKLLFPNRVDAMSGYRYYSAESLWRANTIASLRTLDFGLPEIRLILSTCHDDRELAKFLKMKASELRKKTIAQMTLITRLEKLVVNKQKRILVAASQARRIIHKEVKDIWVVSIHFRGRYSDVGQAFSELFRQYGHLATGAPFSLYPTLAHQEDNAEIEACLPVQKQPDVDRQDIRYLKGGTFITLVHPGPYAHLGDSYKRIFDFIKKENFPIQPPVRELYLKGPGRFFPGSPKTYRTEIQIPWTKNFSAKLSPTKKALRVC